MFVRNQLETTLRIHLEESTCTTAIGERHVAMRQNPVPPVNIPIPAKIDQKIGGHLPQNGTIGFDPQPCELMFAHVETRGCINRRPEIAAASSLQLLQSLQCAEETSREVVSPKLSGSLPHGKPKDPSWMTILNGKPW